LGTFKSHGTQQDYQDDPVIKAAAPCSLRKEINNDTEIDLYIYIYVTEVRRRNCIQIVQLTCWHILSASVFIKTCCIAFH